MKTLVVLSAVLAAAMARPGSPEAVQSPLQDAESSKAPPARTNTMPIQEINVGDLNPAHTGGSLQNPVPNLFQTSMPVNPTQSNSFRVSDGSHSAPFIQYIDNPHMGLPFGTVLPLPQPSNHLRSSPPASPADTLTTVRVDSPHVGLPVNSPASDSPGGTNLVIRPPSTVYTSPSSSPTFGNSPFTFPTNVPSYSGSSPTSLPVNSAGVHHSSLPKNPSAHGINAGFSDVFIPNCILTGNTNAVFPVSKSISLVPSSAVLPSNRASASFPINKANFLASNHYGGPFAKTHTPYFPSKTPPAVFTPSSHHGKFFHNLPVHSATSSHPNSSPQNTLPPTGSSPISNPTTNPLTNIAFTINNPSPSVPLNMPSTDVPTSKPPSSSLVDSGNVLLFSDHVPFGHVVNTAQGPVLVGGPSNFAVFPQQPSLDDINQIMAAYKTAHAAMPAANPAAYGQTASSAPDTIFYAGVPVSLGGCNH